VQLALLAAAMTPVLGAPMERGLLWEKTCKPFHEIYPDGKGLCEQMWGDSFVYEPDDSKGFTMWHFERENPNRKTAALLGQTVPDTCDLQYFHKDKPSPEDDGFTECLPWKEDACCHNHTVTSAEGLRTSYGEGFEWDRCGPMSPECSRFFVQEACFYECDVTAGMYRKCSDAQVGAASRDEDDPCYKNTWEMKGMPIKGSYCDAWYQACRNDYFCSAEDGNFFSCSVYVPLTALASITNVPLAALPSIT
jgi:folate receptor